MEHGNILKEASERMPSAEYGDVLCERGDETHEAILIYNCTYFSLFLANQRGQTRNTFDVIEAAARVMGHFWKNNPPLNPADGVALGTIEQPTDRA